MRLGFTGTRERLPQPQTASLFYLLKDLFPFELHHGDCVGADAEAGTGHQCIREPYPHHIAVVAFLQPTPVQEEETNDEVQHATNEENEEAPTPVRNS